MIEPRAAAWVYVAVLVVALLMVFGVAVFLFLFLAPRAVMGGLGAGCQHGPYCVHVLPSWAQFVLWLSVTALLVWLIFRIAWTLVVVTRASRMMRRAIVAQAEQFDTAPSYAGHASYPVYEVPGGVVVACTLGLRRPVILVSRELRGSLTAEELGVVLAHEHAHAVGRDNLLLLLARALDDALFFIPGVPVAHARVRRCLEIAADAFASRSTGDDLLVASSVSRVARLVFDSSRLSSLAGETISAAFSHGELVIERVERLVRGLDRAPSRRRLLVGVAALATVLMIFGSSLYAVTGNNLTTGAGSVDCTEYASR